MKHCALACTLVVVSALFGCGGRESVRYASGSLVRMEGPWSDGGVDGRVYVTPRVRLFTNVSSRSLRTRLPVVLEYTISGFARFWPEGNLPDVELEVVVYESYEEWREAVKRRFGFEPGEGLGRGAATAGGISLLHDIGEGLTLVLAAHEVWHGYAQRVLVRPLPVGIDEAIACAVEGMFLPDLPTPVYRDNPWRATQFWEFLASGEELGTLADHLGSRPHDFAHDTVAFDAYYARAWCLGMMLFDSGDLMLERGVRQLIADSRVGKRTIDASGSGEEILEQLGTRYFERRPEELEDLWQRTAQRLKDGQ